MTVNEADVAKWLDWLSMFVMQKAWTAARPRTT